MLLIGAKDDPLVPEAVLPHAIVEASPWLLAHFLERGGHCGFLDGGSPRRPRRWAEAQVMRYFSLHAPDVAAAPAKRSMQVSRAL